MLDTIKQLLTLIGISAAAEAVKATGPNQALALPNDFNLHDVEKYLPQRRRARGAMSTSLLQDFSHYVGTFKEEGATVFVDPVKMRATAVLNLGTPATPGHADNSATYAPLSTAAYDALRRAATGQPIGQRIAAEFLEDWGHVVTCFRGDDSAEQVSLPAAVAAVRDITIDQLKKHGASEQQLSAERSTFEKIAVAEGNKLPTIIYFECVPYVGLQSRLFVLRLGIITGDKAPSITLRIVKLEEHAEQMAQELAANVRQSLSGTAPVVVGSYAAGA